MMKVGKRGWHIERDGRYLREALLGPVETVRKAVEEVDHEERQQLWDRYDVMTYPPKDRR
jgi:hypothetical protein